VIEINLLPGSTKRAPRRRLPRVGGRAAPRGVKLPGVDRTIGMVAIAWVIGIAVIGWLHFSTSSRLDELDTELQAAVRDSARYAQLRAQGDSLTAQESVIAQKMQVIQTLDASRYVWPHIMDEVSRALPAYTWLGNMTEAFVQSGNPRVRVEGYAGNTFALTQFMNQLESSPFLHAVRLISSQQSQVDNRTVHNFVLEVGYRDPPPDAIQTVPLFGAIPQEH
jgi:Tfp pilus assembly protein PilN